MNMAKQQVAKTTGNGGDLIPSDLLEEMIANAGAGVSTASDDNILPFILLLQDMNPEVKKRDPAYVDGAEAGMYMNRATKQLFAGDAATAERTGLPMLEFQHAFLDKAVVEWIPRTAGGGFVARHEMQGTVEDTMKSLHGRQVRDPEDPNKMNWKTADGQHDLVETRYHFGNIINNDVAQPAVLAFKSTGHTASKQWNTLTQPAWFRRYIIGSAPKENKKGNFFVTTVTDGGVIQDATLRGAGKALYDGAKAGIIRASTDEGTGGGTEEVSDEI
jgi:hypothetical protein